MFNSTESFERVRHFLEDKNIQFRVIEHAAEGECYKVSALRGHGIEQAAKAIVVMIKTGRKSRRYALAVVLGNMKVLLGEINRLVGGEAALFAPPDRATALTGCEMGAVPPLSFNDELRVICDPRVAEVGELFFNGGRLDRSFGVSARDFVAAIDPVIHRIGDLAS